MFANELLTKTYNLDSKSKNQIKRLEDEKKYREKKKQLSKKNENEE